MEGFPLNFELIGYGNNAILNMGSIFIVNLVQNAFFIMFIVIIAIGVNKTCKKFS
jgi:hypothetical protein